MEPENFNNNDDMMNISNSSDSRPRRNTLAIVAVTLFVLIVGGMFLFAFMTNKEEEMMDDTTDTQMDDADSEIMRINGKRFYIDGVHTVVGEIAMPTPCDLLEVESIVAESYPEQITLDFTVVNEADTCAQVITPQRFKVSAVASEEATFSARYQGKRAELNLIEAAPGETPEDFELYIKG